MAYVRFVTNEDGNNDCDQMVFQGEEKKEGHGERVRASWGYYSPVFARPLTRRLE
jgi:hypothetical protein